MNSSTKTVVLSAKTLSICGSKLIKLLHFKLSLWVLALLLLTTMPLYAQQVFTVTSNPPLTPTTSTSIGSGLTMNIHARNPIEIVEFNTARTASITGYEIWYNVDSVNGPPNISTANGWILHETGPASSANPITLNTPLEIPQGETYGVFYRHLGASVQYQSNPSVMIFGDQNMRFNVGTNVAYAGAPPTPTLHPRAYAGEISYILGAIGDPEASFYIADTVYTGSNTLIQSAHQSAQWTYEWVVDNAPQSTAPEYVFNPQVSGTYNIVLNVSNETMTVSFTRNVVVIDPTGPPVTNFVSNRNLIFMGDSTRFIDLTTQAPDSWFWEVTPETRQIDADPNFPQQPTHGFGHGFNSGSQNPYITFHYPGIYNISLTASRSQLSDTEYKEEYITVAYPLGVIFPIMETTNEPAGAFSDDGGASSYGNQDGKFLIAPCADDLYLTFDQFELECGSAHLRIYDGTSDSTGIPLYGGCSTNGFTGGGNQSGCSVSDVCLPPDTLFSESGRFYIEYDGGSNSNNLSGFLARWGSTSKYQPPEAKFVSPEQVCAGDEIHFDNISRGAGIRSYGWDYTGSGIIADTTEHGKFTYIQPGTYFPILYVEDCAGLKDTFQAQVEVISPATPTQITLTADNYSPWTNEDVVTLNADAQECLSNFEWNISPSSFSFAEGSDQNSRNPQVIFHQPGCYEVQLIASNSSGSANVIEQCLIEVRGYCTPVIGQTSEDIGVSRVVLAELDHSSPVGNKTYSNFTEDHIANLRIGETYQIMVQRKTTSNNMDRAIWIDWNQNGSFNDSIELIAYESNARTSSYTASFTVPGIAAEGRTRLRIGTGFGGSTLNSCGNQFIGEFVDYGIFILPNLTEPTITLLGDNPLYIDVFTPFNEPGYSAWSNPYGDLTNDVIVDYSALNTDSLGTYYINYFVADKDGISAEKQREVVVQDTILPEIELIDSDTLTVEVNTTFEDPGVVINDNYWQDIMPDISGNLDMQSLGYYEVIYCATDGSGNGPVCVTRIIEVVDTTPPDILIPSDTLVTEVLEPFDFDAIMISDNYWSADNIDIEITGINDIPDALGDHMVTISATDGSGNTGEATFIVRVVDTTPPVITLDGEPTINIPRYHGFQDPWVTVEDNFDPEPEVVVGGSFQGTDVPGVYNITYYAVDQSGNESQTVERRIFVDPAISIDELSGYNVSVYPNPANNYFDVDITGMSPSTNIEVTDLTGRTIEIVNANDFSNNTYRFDTMHYTEGIYLVRVSDNERAVIKKVNILR